MIYALVLSVGRTMNRTGSLRLTSGGALEGAATARYHGFAGPKFSSSDSIWKADENTHIEYDWTYTADVPATSKGGGLCRCGLLHAWYSMWSNSLLTLWLIRCALKDNVVPAGATLR